MAFFIPEIIEIVEALVATSEVVSSAAAAGETAVGGFAAAAEAVGGVSAAEGATAAQALYMGGAADAGMAVGEVLGGLGLTAAGVGYAATGNVSRVGSGQLPPLSGGLVGENITPVGPVKDGPVVYDPFPSRPAKVDQPAQQWQNETNNVFAYLHNAYKRKKKHHKNRKRIHITG